MGDYKINDIYQGGYDSLDPNKERTLQVFMQKQAK
jgi:hypothetical protein